MPAEDVEEAHSIGVQPVDLLVHLSVHLIHLLRQRIGRKRLPLMSLLLRKLCGISVNRGTGSIGKTLHAVLS